MPASGYEFDLRASIQVDISLLPDIDLNTRRLKFVSTRGHVIFCLLLDIDELPWERFLGLIVE